MSNIKGKVFRVNDFGREEVASLNNPLDQFPELKDLYKKYNIKRMVFDVDGQQKHTVEISRVVIPQEVILNV